MNGRTVEGRKEGKKEPTNEERKDGRKEQMTERTDGRTDGQTVGWMDNLTKQGEYRSTSNCRQYLELRVD